MTHDEYTKAASYWTEQEAASTGKMDLAALKARVEALLAEHNTCALATATGDFVRCTPIEYSYHDGALWMFSEGGQKFRALEHNANVCLAIFRSFTGFGDLFGMQVTGTAEIVEAFSPDYIAAAQARHIRIETLRRMPHPMHLIKVTPREVELISSDLRKEGYDVRQHLDLTSSR